MFGHGCTRTLSSRLRWHIARRHYRWVSGSRCYGPWRRRTSGCQRTPRSVAGRRTGNGSLPRPRHQRLGGLLRRHSPGPAQQPVPLAFSSQVLLHLGWQLRPRQILRVLVHNQLDAPRPRSVPPSFGPAHAKSALAAATAIRKSARPQGSLIGWPPAAVPRATRESGHGPYSAEYMTLPVQSR